MNARSSARCRRRSSSRAINVDELLQTQRFYAVGSVIAMPKVEISEPVLEPESFSLIDSTDRRIAAASALNTDDAPLPESLEVPAGPPPADAPPRAPPRRAGIQPRHQGRRARHPQARRRPAARTIKLPTTGELRQQAQVAAPKALKEAVRDTGVELKPETLRTARRSAEDTFKANTPDRTGAGRCRHAQGGGCRRADPESAAGSRAPRCRYGRRSRATRPAASSSSLASPASSRRAKAGRCASPSASTRPSSAKASSTSRKSRPMRALFAPQKRERRRGMRRHARHREDQGRPGAGDRMRRESAAARAASTSMSRRTSSSPTR